MFNYLFGRARNEESKQKLARFNKTVFERLFNKTARELVNSGIPIRYSLTRLKFIDVKNSRSLITRIGPGEIIRLNYEGSTIKRIFLTAYTGKSPKGWFNSTRDNTLLCCFEVNEKSLSFKLILKLLHKHAARCKYNLVPSFLKIIFGVSAYKTLNVEKIKNLQVLLRDEDLI
jgi:hypothetical protein